MTALMEPSKCSQKSKKKKNSERIKTRFSTLVYKCNKKMSDMISNQEWLEILSIKKIISFLLFFFLSSSHSQYIELRAFYDRLIELLPQCLLLNLSR